jgi:predicted kinase
MSGKTHLTLHEYAKTHQVINLESIRDALKKELLPTTDEIVYGIVSTMTRSVMIMELPIVVDEKNLTAESLFIWKKLAVQYGYSIKGVVLDTNPVVCIKRNEIDKKYKCDNGPYYWEKEMLDEIKTVLSMKHQNILDSFEVLTNYGGKRDEIL